MSNVCTNAVFRLLSARRIKPIARVICIYDPDLYEDAATFERMVAAIPEAPIVDFIQSANFSLTADDTTPIVVFGSNHTNRPLGKGLQISTTPLNSEDPDFGFYQEAQAHDYELGGVIEWNEGIPCQFSRFVLQSLSRVHVRRFFPFQVWREIIDAGLYDGTKRLRCLDVGCGPISKLRYGALSGWLYIVGVDPLNDMYTAILARHALLSLEKIRPDVVINGFAEEQDFRSEPFDFIYTVNALDHTQDLVQSVSHIAQNLRPGGIAYIEVNTKEGERQNYSGLHKFNIWADDDRIMFNERDTAPEDLLMTLPSIDLYKIYRPSDGVTAFAIRRSEDLG